MVARDDSVIRGSLIASLVFLVLSLAANVFFWQWGNTQSKTATEAKDSLSSTRSDLRNLQSQADLMKSMLGVGNATEAEREELARSVEGDPEMESILDQYRKDMAYFGQEVDPQNQNYRALPEFLVNSIRSGNERLVKSRSDEQSTRASAEQDVSNAREAQKIAEDAAAKAEEDLATAQSEFAKERDEMRLLTQKTEDELKKARQDLAKARQTYQSAEQNLEKQIADARSVIDDQRVELNRLRSDRFESFQGQVTYVRGGNGGNVVQINLGKKDKLRPGVTFGVLDGDALQPEKAKVLATIEVTKVHKNYSDARVVARSAVRYPITRGDKVYSPFWAPGRTVKIALVGKIDIDDDGIPDNEQIRAQIESVGAEVVDARVVGDPEAGNLRVEGLDSSVRFLVEGSRTELVNTADDATNKASQMAAQREGTLIAAAQDKGVTVIPAWKLQAYLRTIDDSMTTPLGSAVRSSDFPPESTSYGSSNQGGEVSELYRQQLENVQRGNRIDP